MGTVCIITLYNGESQEIYDEVFDLIAAQDQLMSLQKEESNLGDLAREAGQNSIEVSTHTYEVIEASLRYAEMSRGAFDPTIAPLVELWGIGGLNQGAVPDEETITQVNALTNYKAVQLLGNNTVFLQKEGMKVDLGSIAKGYIADKVKELLDKKGVERGIINLGGNIVVIGSKPENQPWRIGIQDPYDTRGDYIGIVSVADKTVVTSGIYERFFMKDGIRYHHILDPETGYPVDNELASVSIIADRSMDADALSTSLFVLGIEEGMKVIESMKGAEAIFVTKNKELVLSSGADEIFELNHKDYTYGSTLSQ